MRNKTSEGLHVFYPCSFPLVTAAFRPDARPKVCCDTCDSASRRYREAAQAAHAQYLAALHNETLKEERIDEAKYQRESRRAHVFDGKDADAVTRQARQAEADRERAAEAREQAYAAASSEHTATRLQTAAAREEGSAAREAAEAAADRHGGAFTLRDKAAADAAAEREASAEEATWESSVAR